MTPESRLYTFVDRSREFVLYFLEGQSLIQELALLHPIRRAGFARGAAPRQGGNQELRIPVWGRACDIPNS